MALSEQEQELLQQMEQALYADDPKFATNIRTAGGSASRGRATVGVLTVLGGMLLLVIGVAVGPVVGVAGFAVMLVGAVTTYTAFTTKAITKLDGDPEFAESSHPTMPKTSGGGFYKRAEDRWRKRTEGEWSQ